MLCPFRKISKEKWIHFFGEVCKQFDLFVYRLSLQHGQKPAVHKAEEANKVNEGQSKLFDIYK